MSDTNIYREMTPTEKKETVDLMDKTPTPSLMFRKQLVDKEKQYSKNRKPFCFRCAKIDFDDAIKRARQEASRVSGVVDISKLNMIKEQSVADLDNYGGDKRFMFVKVEEKKKDGPGKTKLPVFFYDYMCKVRGCGVSIELSEEEHKAKQERKK